MCWKQEWAAAVNNLQWAIIHTERAKAKLEYRVTKFEEGVRNADKSEIDQAHLNLEKSRRGVAECNELITRFKKDQEQLKKLIDEVGLWVKDDPARTKTLMAGRRLKRGQPWDVPTRK